MNIDEILNMIDDMLEEAWSLPFSGGRCVVDAQKVKECVEDIRLNLPGEIKQAKMIVADRNDIIKGAELMTETTAIYKWDAPWYCATDCPGGDCQAGAGEGGGHHRPSADGGQGDPPRLARVLRLDP